MDKHICRRRWLNRTRLLSLLLLPLIAQCQGRTNGSEHFDLSNPEIIELSHELREISGIVFEQDKLYAITDNTGSLYQLDTDNGNILEQWQFKKPDDYEDVTIAEGRFYVLNSNGNIVSFTLPVDGKPEIKEFNFPFGKGNEFEILYYDESRKNLVMICKECKDDKKKSLTAYMIDPITAKYSPAGFEVDAKEVAKKNNATPERLKPSAAAVHPQTGEVYMISSINKMLIRFSRSGEVLSVSSFKRSLFEQPEGIAFTPGGDMLISNEAGEKERATLLLFKYILK